MKKVVNDLLQYENLKIVQRKDMFNFSLDSVLLPRFVTINKKDNLILDIGTGNAPIPLILSKISSAKIHAVEIQKDSYDLAKESIKLNKLEETISLFHEDIKEFSKKCESDTYDIILCNPPFFEYKEESNLNKSYLKTLARHEESLTLQELLKISRKLLKNKGRIALVHRSNRVVDILTELRVNNLEPKKIRFIYPKNGEDSNIILIEASKNGGKGITVCPPLYVHNDDGTYTDEVKKIFK